MNGIIRKNCIQKEFVVRWPFTEYVCIYSVTYLSFILRIVTKYFMSHFLHGNLFHPIEALQKKFQMKQIRL